MTEFLKSVGEHVGAWLYLIAAAFAFCEAAILVGMVIPGETALLVAGYFCHEKVLDLRIMVPLAIVAAIAGDSVGFEFGRKFGPGFRRSRVGRWVGESRWNTVDKFLPFKIANLLEDRFSSQVIRPVGVTPGACKRAFFCYLNGKEGSTTRKYRLPAT